MQVQCPCGATLPDTSDRLPFKAAILPDAEYAAAFETVTAGLVEFFAASAAGRRAEWVAKYFGPHWPRELPDAEHLDEFIHNQIMGRTRLLYECWQCGRLLIQPHRGDFRLVASTPDRVGCHRLLASPAEG